MEITKAVEIRRKEMKIDGIHLRYILTCTEDMSESDGFNIIYSLEVSSKDCDTMDWETEYLEDISRNQIEALRLFELFANETVMPCTARYIMEDLLS